MLVKNRVEALDATRLSMLQRELKSIINKRKELFRFIKGDVHFNNVRPQVRASTENNYPVMASIMWKTKAIRHCERHPVVEQLEVMWEFGYETKNLYLVEGRKVFYGDSLLEDFNVNHLELYKRSLDQTGRMISVSPPRGSVFQIRRQVYAAAGSKELAEYNRRQNLVPQKRSYESSILPWQYVPSDYETSGNEESDSSESLKDEVFSVQRFIKRKRFS